MNVPRPLSSALDARPKSDGLGQREKGYNSSAMIVFLLTIAIIGAVLLVMSVGVILNGRCLRGSCGGPGGAVLDGEPIPCACGRSDTKLEPEQGSNPAGT